MSSRPSKRRRGSDTASESRATERAGPDVTRDVSPPMTANPSARSALKRDVSCDTEQSREQSEETARCGGELLGFGDLALASALGIHARERGEETARPARIVMAAAEAAGKGKPRVVVVGGGIGGSLLARTMQHDADVVLLDPKEYLEISWAELRSMVEPSFAERSLIYHRDYLTSATIVTSSAVNITEHAVLTADGQSLAYDYLVIATGHALTSPGSRTERITEFQRDNGKIASSESVLIIGGGPTGVELAAEIAVDYPEKKVTIVHRGSRLLEFVDKKASKKCLDWLTSKKVDVLFQQSVDLDSLSNTEKFYKTSGGETITADCHFVCIGKPLSSSWLHDTILKESLDNKGRVMVEKDLRVKGYNNTFAIGDITDIPEIKQGYLAQKHALLVAKNLKLLIKGSPESKLATYSTGYPLAIVSLGRNEGLAQLPFVTLTGCLPGRIKSRDLFVGKTRKQMGLDG